MRSDEKCCCFCRHNIRTEEEKGYIKCHCDIDGHEIGYVACFEGWCRRWARNKKKDKIEREEEDKLLWEDDDSEGGLISED